MQIAETHKKAFGRINGEFIRCDYPLEYIYIAYSAIQIQSNQKHRHLVGR